MKDPDIDEQTREVQLLNPASIRRSPYQVRTEEEPDEGLVQSIATHGLLNPITVRADVDKDKDGAPIHELIAGRKLLLIDDSIVRGTQLRETAEYLYKSGAQEIHIRPACPPLVFGCKYMNFSRSKSEKELITHRVIEKLENVVDPSRELLDQYTDPDSDKYEAMLEEIRKELNFTSLHYHRLDDMIEAIGLEPCKLCTYCWNGRE